jgi:hypothetical protein
MLCGRWLANNNLDWFARTIAARILWKVPTQHAFFVECLKREQENTKQDGEETAILRQELSFGAFQRIKSPKKQLALFKLIIQDPSLLVKRLTLYLLQQPQCKVKWNELKPYHEKMRPLSDIIKTLGISQEITKPCFITQTMTAMYKVQVSIPDLRDLYGDHYKDCVHDLRKSTIEYHRSPSDYVHYFHRFIHLTLIAFYESVLPNEIGLYEGYARLTDRKVLSDLLPEGIKTWKDLGGLRIRVDHPVERKTKARSRKITVKELEFFFKKIQFSLQELFNVWINNIQNQHVGEQVLSQSHDQ